MSVHKRAVIDRNAGDSANNHGVSYSSNDNEPEIEEQTSERELLSL